MSTNAVVLIIKGAISELDPVHREHVENVHLRLAALVDDNGDAGLLALALLGAERAE
jgi:hypothetical protein